MKSKSLITILAALLVTGGYGLAQNAGTGRCGQARGTCGHACDGSGMFTQARGGNGNGQGMRRGKRDGSGNGGGEQKRDRKRDGSGDGSGTGCGQGI